MLYGTGLTEADMNKAQDAYAELLKGSGVVLCLCLYETMEIVWIFS